MQQSREWLIQWLRDAHAMEEQAETMLSGQESRLENYPELRSRIAMHVEETKQQAARLKTCLEGLDEGSSSLKDAGGKLMATAQAIGGSFAGDEVLKGSIAGYAFEHGRLAEGTHARHDGAVPDALGDRSGRRQALDLSSSVARASRGERWDAPASDGTLSSECRGVAS